MNKQILFLRRTDMQAHNTVSIRTMGLEQPELSFHRGDAWQRSQICRGQHYVLNALESFGTDEEVTYTYQEDYIKINFWLSGKHTTVLDGFGEHEHDRPEIFITAGPRDMVKVDMCSRNAQVTSLSVCLLPDFFPVHMGVSVDQLPTPLRALLVPNERPFGFYRLPLTPALLAAARAILAAPFAVRRLPLYTQAKAVELLCLLISQMESNSRKTLIVDEPPVRHARRLREAFEIVARDYRNPLTVHRISRQVGLNKMALTSGFRRLYGMSVYDFLQKVRMERAYELLQDPTTTIKHASATVGYRHPCNFSTAFSAYYGCTPESLRKENSV